MSNQLNWKLLGLAAMMMLWPVFGAGQVNLDSGLVAYWPFTDSAVDVSGNNHTGEIFGASDTTDRFGNEKHALFFDGQNDYIIVPDAASLR